MRLNDLRLKREQILALAARHGAANVRIFGSVARGEARSESDVDILVDVIDLSRFTWGGGGLLMDLQDLLHCRVDLVTPDDLHWQMRDQVLAEAVPL